MCAVYERVCVCVHVNDSNFIVGYAAGLGEFVWNFRKISYAR